MKPYALSNNQRKELAERAGALTIAVPIPARWMPDREPTPAEMRRLVVESIEGIELHHVGTVSESEVVIDPWGTQRGQLPAIVPADREREPQHLVVAVVLAEVTMAAERRGRNPKPQFPGRVMELAR